MTKFEYKMRSRVWLDPHAAGWHFITLPKKQSSEIKALFGTSQKAWGSLPVIATVGRTIWKTSIFFDRKSGAYVMPLKADVRKKEEIAAHQVIAFSVQIKP